MRRYAKCFIANYVRCAVHQKRGGDQRLAMLIGKARCNTRYPRRLTQEWMMYWHLTIGVYLWRTAFSKFADTLHC